MKVSSCCFTKILVDTPICSTCLDWCDEIEFVKFEHKPSLKQRILLKLISFHERVLHTLRGYLTKREEKRFRGYVKSNEEAFIRSLRHLAQDTNDPTSARFLAEIALKMEQKYGVKN